MHDEHSDIAKLGELIKSVRIAMLTTTDPDGGLRSRPMVTQATEFDGDLWFFTDEHSGKTISIEQDQHVNLSYVDTENKRFISVTGRASVVKDRKQSEKLWHPALKAYFPKGLEDPELALLKVRVESAEYWASAPNAAIRTLGVLKAMLTGHRYEGGTNERLDLRH